MIAASPLAIEVAERIGRIEEPWDVYAGRARRFEIQLTGSRVEIVRGPLRLDGYGIRILKRVGDQTGVGFQASSDFTPEGIRSATGAAQAIARFNRFPARRPELPTNAGGSPSAPKLVDQALWSDPLSSLQQEAATLLSAFDAQRLAPPTFAILRVTLLESSIANSRGFAGAFGQTVVGREIAVKAEGGPEGPAAGEFWFTDLGRRLQLDRLEERVRQWDRLANDARHAVPPPTGETAVVLPPDVLGEILPAVFGFQFSAVAQLRGLAVSPETAVAPERLDISDDGLRDWAVGSSPFDDEGTPQRLRHLVAHGRASETVSDVLYADALGGASTGNAARSMQMDLGASYSRKFTRAPRPDLTTLVLSAGDGGSDVELLEQVEEGLLIEQLGWAQPDPISATFGAEIRIGYHIRRGKLAEPIRGGTIGGSVVTRDGRPSMLSGVQVIGSQARLTGGLLSPTLVVRNLAVSGSPASSSGPSS